MFENFTNIRPIIDQYKYILRDSGYNIWFNGKDIVDKVSSHYHIEPGKDIINGEEVDKFYESDEFLEFIERVSYDLGDNFKIETMSINYATSGRIYIKIIPLK